MLLKGSSRSTISKNISEMMHHGHEQKQAIAASLRSAGKSIYQKKRKAGRMNPRGKARYIRKRS